MTRRFASTRAFSPCKSPCRVRDLTTGAVPAVAGPVEPARLEQWIERCLSRWRALVDPLPTDSPERCPHGYYFYAYELGGEVRRTSPAEFPDLLQRSVTRHTGWPPFWYPTRAGTLPDILRLYADKAFRRGVVAGISNPVVRAFWRSEFANYPPRYAAEALAPIQNKLSALLADPMLYRVLVTPQVDLHFRQIMDEGRVLVVNLAKGRIGSDSALALGSLLVSTLGLAALSRAELPPAQRRPFFLYVDEFQTRGLARLARLKSA